MCLGGYSIKFTAILNKKMQVKVFNSSSLVFDNHQPEITQVLHSVWFRFSVKSFQIYLSLIIPFFISSRFISNGRLKLAKNQAKAKKHPQADPLLFEMYIFTFFTHVIIQKIIGDILKNVRKTNACVLVRLHDQ